MFEKLRAILSKVDADYADIRYEQKKDTVVSFSGKELTEIGSNSTDGFVVRALKNGGMASAVFCTSRKITSEAKPDPPGESMRKTIAFTSQSRRARRRASAIVRAPMISPVKRSFRSIPDKIVP